MFKFIYILMIQAKGLWVSIISGRFYFVRNPKEDRWDEDAMWQELRKTTNYCGKAPIAGLKFGDGCALYYYCSWTSGNIILFLIPHQLMIWLMFKFVY